MCIYLAHHELQSIILQCVSHTIMSIIFIVTVVIIAISKSVVIAAYECRIHLHAYH